MRIEVAGGRARRLFRCDALSVAVGFVYDHRNCSSMSLPRRQRPRTHFTTATKAWLAAALTAHGRAFMALL